MAQVEANVRTSNEDARAFIRQSVLDVWSTPFPAYTAPVSSKSRGRLAHAAAQLSLDPSAAPPPPPPAAAPAPALPPRRLVNHFVMNLPNSAIEFLDAYRGLYRALYEVPGAREAVEAAGPGKLPMVHCYCFTKDMEHAEEDILAVRFPPAEDLGLFADLDLDRRSARLLPSGCPSRRTRRTTTCASCATSRRRRRCTASSSASRQRWLRDVDAKD